MPPPDILSQVASIIREVSLSGPVPIARETKALDVRGWDSLSHTMVLMKIEDHFGISLPVERTLRLNNVGELVDLVSVQLSAVNR